MSESRRESGYATDFVAPETENELHRFVRSEMLSGRRFRCRVLGGSMSPVLRAGDVILILPEPPAALKPGDIVQVCHNDQVVTHRLMAIADGPGSKSATTKGDRALVPDGVWPLSSIVGRVAAVDRGAKSLVIGGNLWYGWVSKLLLFEWRCLSRLDNWTARRALHYGSLLVVRVLCRFAWAGSRTVMERG